MSQTLKELKTVFPIWFTFSTYSIIVKIVIVMTFY